MKLPKLNFPRIPLPGNRVLTGHGARDSSDEGRSRLRRVADHLHLPTVKLRPRRKGDRVFGTRVPVPPDAPTTGGGETGRPLSSAQSGTGTPAPVPDAPTTAGEGGGRPLSGSSATSVLPVELQRQILRPLLLGREVQFQGRTVYFHNARSRPGSPDSQARQTGAQAVVNSTRVSRGWRFNSPWDMMPLAELLSRLDRISFDELDQSEEMHAALHRHSLSTALRLGLGLSSDRSAPGFDPRVLDKGECQLFDMTSDYFARYKPNVKVRGKLRTEEDPPAGPGEPMEVLERMDPRFVFLVEGPRGAQAMGLHALIQELLSGMVRGNASSAARRLLIAAIENLTSPRERLTCFLHLHVAVTYPDRGETREAYRQEALKAARHLDHRNVQDTLEVLLPRASSGQHDARERPVVIEILCAYIRALASPSGQQPSGSAASPPTGGPLGTGDWPTAAALDQIEDILALEAGSETLEDERDVVAVWVSEQRSGAPAPARANVPE